MKPIAFFLRVSTSSQQLESQRDEMLKYAAFDGIKEEDVDIIQYKESGRKLKEEERLGIKDFKTRCEQEPYKCVYISELSRIARTEKVLYSFIDYLEEHHIQLKCKNPEFTLFKKDFSGWEPNARILVGMFAALAAQEVVEKKIRFARGKERKAKEGKYTGGEVPYGYRVDAEHGNKIVPDDYEKAIVQEIYNLYESGLSLKAIAREMRERGVKGKGVRNKTKNFTLSLVQQILTNEILYGKPCKNKSASYERQYEPIITEEQFKRCREIAKRNRTELPKSRRVYYASGLIKCTCGHAFNGVGKKGYYRCRYATYATYTSLVIDGYNGKRCDNNITISVNVMDSLLWQVAIDMESEYILNSSQEKILELEKEKSVIKQKLDAIPSRLELVVDKRERLAEVYTDGSMSRETYLKRKEKLSEEEQVIRKEKVQYQKDIDGINNQIKNLKVNIDIQKDVLDNPDKVLSIHDRVESITDDTERKKIIQKHIEKITVERTTIKYKFASYKEPKDVDARLITITPRLTTWNPQYVYIPNSGNGGIMLEKISDSERTEMVLGQPVTIPQYRVFPLSYYYLNRMTDEQKKERRKKKFLLLDKAKRTARTKMRDSGYISVPELQDRTNLSRTSFLTYFKQNKLHGEKVGGVWFVKEDEFEDFLEKYHPKAQNIDSRSPEQKLLDCLKIVEWLYDE